ncbi:MAG: SoxR reducing system RseC family protein [Bacteroidales bacterium]|nr:SoxR reducing system RseC family protein [Bacteroidales bacterium]
MNNEVCKSGVIKYVDSEKVVVSLIRTEACGTCQVKNACHNMNGNVQDIEIPIQAPVNYKTGDKVEVVISEGKALLAVVLSFIIPVVLLLLFFFLLQHFYFNEGMSALIAVGITTVYYLFLYFVRSGLKKTFHFTIRKNDSVE